MDVNQPVTNPNLVIAMQQLLAELNAIHESEFVEELKKAHFLAPVTITPTPELTQESGKAILKEATTIGFQMIMNDENYSFFPLFTDCDELRKWSRNSDQQTLIVTFDDISAMLLRDTDTSNGAIINPYGHNILLDKTHVAMLNGKPFVQPYRVEQETQVFLGEPREYPHALVEAVKCFLKTVKNVKKAYLMLMVKNDEQSVLIVVDFKGDKNKLFHGIASAANPYLKAGQLIDMVSANEQFGQKAIRGKKPFYSKSLFGF